MKNIILAILFTLTLGIASAQEKVITPINTPDTTTSSSKLGYTLYVNQPIGIVYGGKIRVRVEKRYSENKSVLLSFTSYFTDENYFLPWRGNQLSIESRKYRTPYGWPPNKFETFYTFKGGIGNINNNYYDENKTLYLFIGLATGQKFYLGESNKFSLDITEGMKLPVLFPNRNPRFRELFYLIGPGSFIDLNFNFGYHF